MTAFASDTFDAGTHLTDIVGNNPTVGGAWTDGSDSGSPSPIYDGNRARQADAQTSFTYPATTPSSNDYTVSVDITPQFGGSGGVAGVCGRKNAATGSVSCYWADYYDHATAGSRQWRLYKVVAGAYTSLGSYTQNIGTTTTTLTLEMIGSAIKVYVDGVERISATDSAIAGPGRAGIVLGNAAAPGTNCVYLNNFTATTLEAPLPLRRRPSGLYTR